MYMRIIWGRIVAGQWDGFEAAYKKATTLRGDVKGLKNQWLARDQADPDAGYSITLWESEKRGCQAAAGKSCAARGDGASNAARTTRMIFPVFINSPEST